MALIRAERIRQDVAAYAAAPATPDEVSLATASTAAWSDLADDTAWDGVYPDHI